MRPNLRSLLRVGGLLLLILLVASPRIALTSKTPMPGTSDMGGILAPGTTTAIPSHHFHPASGYCPPYYQPPYPPVYLPPGLYECWPCVCTKCENEEEPSFTIVVRNGNGKGGNGRKREGFRRREKEERIRREYEQIPEWIWRPLPLREFIREPTEETPGDRPDTRLGEGIDSPSERTWPHPPPGLGPGEGVGSPRERTWPYPPGVEEPIRVDQTPPMLEGTVYPVSESGWVNRNVKVTLFAGDEEGGSGIAAIHYLWNGRQVTITGEDLHLSPDKRTATHKIALQEDGLHELVCWTVDAAGNESNRTSSTVRIDKIAPGISATSAPTTEGGWGNANAKVTLSAQDQAGGSGIASIEYTLDGREVVIEKAQLRQTYDTFAHKLAVTVEGVHRMTFRTKDLAGNWSGSGSRIIRIDRTPPMIEATRSPAPTEHGWNNQDVTVRFHCSDDLSGIASCTNEQRVSSEGSGQIVMGEAVDRAGNSVKAYVTNISIDRTPPSVSVSPYSPSITSGEAIVLTIEASDAGSGIAYVIAEDSTSGRISLGREGDRWTGNLQPGQDGQITIRVTDGADNVITRSVSYMVEVAVSAPLRIAFISVRDGDEDIYVMNADGSDQTNLTNNSAGYSALIWSPDGKQIMFTSHRDGNHEIYVMNADGSDQRRLTHNSSHDLAPVWSPDGKQIAFMSARDETRTTTTWCEIYVMNADGSDQERLTHNSTHDSSPAWSPDGKRIAFYSTGDVKSEIYVMNADGSGRTRLTYDALSWSPAWSPDGKRMAFALNRDGKSEIYVMSANGSGQTRLTYDSATARRPAWSPDGKCIMFTSDREGNYDIYVMNADGSGQRNLTNNPAHDLTPAWSPDGKRIVFASDREGNYDIYVMNANGSGQTRLTCNSDLDTGPAWSPQ